MKTDELNKDTLYLIKRHDGSFIIAYPLFDLGYELCGWWDQNFVSQVYYEDDKIIGSLDKIERNSN